MLELKAVTQLEKVHIAQAINYLEAYKIETGLIINFGATSLEFKRLTIEKKLRNLNQRNTRIQQISDTDK